MIRIIFVGKTKEQWLREQVDEYVKRTGRWVRLQVDELKDEKVVGSEYDKVKNKEGERILKLVSDQDYLIALDENGHSIKSKQFAQSLGDAVVEHKRITFVVGGALGLSDAVLKRADYKLSISKMTLTNQMVRLVLVEQIYRAFTIMAGMEYHK